MLGCVKEVSDFEMTIGLPCGLTGFLSIKNISDSYTKLLSEQLESDETEVILWSDAVNILDNIEMSAHPRIFCHNSLIFGRCASQELCSLPLLFHPGMVLRCVVVKLDVAKGGSLSIKLSVNPKLVNKGLTSSSLKAGMVSH